MGTPQPIVKITTTYGFVRSWTLDAYGKQFYLGQDIKFCRRVLGAEPTQVAYELGTNDLTEDRTRRRLARYILHSLDLDKTKLRNLQPWELCAE